MQQDSEELFKFITDQGYTDLRVVDGKLCGLMQMSFTHALVVDMTWAGYARRYCYEHKSDALMALNIWDGADHPSGPWIKLKGIGVDLLNPLLTS